MIPPDGENRGSPEISLKCVDVEALSKRPNEIIPEIGDRLKEWLDGRPLVFCTESPRKHRQALNLGLPAIPPLYTWLQGQPGVRYTVEDSVTADSDFSDAYNLLDGGYTLSPKLASKKTIYSPPGPEIVWVGNDTTVAIPISDAYSNYHPKYPFERDRPPEERMRYFQRMRGDEEVSLENTLWFEGLGGSKYIYIRTVFSVDLDRLKPLVREAFFEGGSQLPLGRDVGELAKEGVLSPTKTYIVVQEVGDPYSARMTHHKIDWRNPLDYIPRDLITRLKGDTSDSETIPPEVSKLSRAWQVEPYLLLSRGIKGVWEDVLSDVKGAPVFFVIKINGRNLVIPSYGFDLEHSIRRYIELFGSNLRNFVDEFNSFTDDHTLGHYWGALEFLNPDGLSILVKPDYEIDDHGRVLVKYDLDHTKQLLCNLRDGQYNESAVRRLKRRISCIEFLVRFLNL